MSLRGEMNDFLKAYTSVSGVLQKENDSNVKSKYYDALINMGQQKIGLQQQMLNQRAQALRDANSARWASIGIQRDRLNAYRENLKARQGPDPFTDPDVLNAGRNSYFNSNPRNIVGAATQPDASSVNTSPGTSTYAVPPDTMGAVEPDELDELDYAEGGEIFGDDEDKPRAIDDDATEGRSPKGYDYEGERRKKITYDPDDDYQRPIDDNATEGRSQKGYSYEGERRKSITYNPDEDYQPIESVPQSNNDNLEAEGSQPPEPKKAVDEESPPANDTPPPAGPSVGVVKSSTGFDQAQVLSRWGVNPETNPVHLGLTAIADMERQKAGPGAVPVGAPDQTPIGHGIEPATREDTRIMDQIVDPHHELSRSALHIARLDAITRFYLNRGDIQKAQKMAASLIVSAGLDAQMYGDAALKAMQSGHTEAAVDMIKHAYDQIPNGHEFEARVLPDGRVHAFDIDRSSGEERDLGTFGPQQVLQLAKGIANGSQYWQTMVQLGSSLRGMGTQRQTRQGGNIQAPRLGDVKTAEEMADTGRANLADKINIPPGMEDVHKSVAMGLLEDKNNLSQGMNSQIANRVAADLIGVGTDNMNALTRFRPIKDDPQGRWGYMDEHGRSWILPNNIAQYILASRQSQRNTINTENEKKLARAQQEEKISKASEGAKVIGQQLLPSNRIKAAQQYLRERQKDIPEGTNLTWDDIRNVIARPDEQPVKGRMDNAQQYFMDRQKSIPEGTNLTWDDVRNAVARRDSQPVKGRMSSAQKYLREHQKEIPEGTNLTWGDIGRAITGPSGQPTVKELNERRAQRNKKPKAVEDEE